MSDYRYKTEFIMLIGEGESECLSLSGSPFIVTDYEPEIAVAKFIANGCKIHEECSDNHSYSVVYADGHYGEKDYEWEYSGCEIYRPDDITKPALVVVRYKPAPTHHSLQQPDNINE